MSCVPIFAHFFTFSSRVNDYTTVLPKFQMPCIVDFNSLQESSNFPPVTPYYAYFYKVVLCFLYYAYFYKVGTPLVGLKIWNNGNIFWKSILKFSLTSTSHIFYIYTWIVKVLNHWHFPFEKQSSNNHRSTMHEALPSFSKLIFTFARTLYPA